MADKKTVSRDAKATPIDDVIPKMDGVDAVVKCKDIMDKDIVIEGYEMMNGKDGDFAFIRFHEYNQEGTIGMSCGGKVVIKKLKQIGEKNKFPILCKLIMKDDYYDLT